MNKIILDRENYKIVINKDYNEDSVIKAFCDVCLCLIRTQFDEDAMIKMNCCFNCSTEFAYPNKEEWDKGWRPKKDEILENISKRPGIMINIDIKDI